MTETWIEKKDKVKKRLPGDYVWSVQETVKKNKKGKVME